MLHNFSTDIQTLFFLNKIILAEAVFLVALSMVLLYRKIGSQKKREVARRSKEYFYKLVGDLYENKTTSKEIAKDFAGSHEAFRNFIADLCLSSKGNFSNTLRSLYEDMGYYSDDLTELEDHHLRSTRINALYRLEQLGLTIPHAQHLDLVRCDDPDISGMAMYQYIIVHREKSLFLMLEFINSGNCTTKGLLVYLVETFTKQDPESISFLFKHSPSQALDEVLLGAAYSHRPSGFDELIYKKIKWNTSTTILVWVLRILALYPSEKMIHMLKMLKEDKAWPVRLHVLRCAAVLEYKFAMPFLKLYLSDTSYQIRNDAAKFLVQNFIAQDKQDENIIGSIINNPDHPSHDLLHFYLTETKVTAKNDNLEIKSAA